MRPFHVFKSMSGWALLNRTTGRTFWGFTTAAEANDYARRNWPWWP